MLASELQRCLGGTSDEEGSARCEDVPAIGCGSSSCSSTSGSRPSPRRRRRSRRLRARGSSTAGRSSAPRRARGPYRASCWPRRHEPQSLRRCSRPRPGETSCRAATVTDSAAAAGHARRSVRRLAARPRERSPPAPSLKLRRGRTAAEGESARPTSVSRLTRRTSSSAYGGTQQQSSRAPRP